MADIKNIKNDDLGATEKIGGDFFDTDKDGTSRGTEKTLGAENEIVSETEEDFVDQGRSPTPFEISRMRYYNSEKKKNDAKVVIFNVLKYLIPIFTSIIIALLAFFGSVWAYKLNNIAEPIGGLKVEAQYLKKDITELKAEVRGLQERINNMPMGQ